MPPQLTTPVELPAKFDDIITVYPDSENTPTTRRYWLVPTVARIVRHGDGKLAFGLIHAGVSAFDPDGIQALLTVTMQPYIDQATLSDAKKLIEKTASGEGAKNISFTFVVPTETTARLLIGGQFVDFSGGQQTIVKGGDVAAGIPFSVKVKDSFDVRCLSQAGGGDDAVFGVLYTMRFKGVGTRLHFKVTADFEETFKHFKAQVSGSAWWGLVKTNLSYEYQELLKTGAVKLTVYSGTDADVEKYGARDILNTLLQALTNRTGLFAKVLKPAGLPDAPGGGGYLGWGISAGGGYEEYKDKTQLVVEVDKQTEQEHELAFGMTFKTGGAELVNYVKNLTDTAKPFPTSGDFAKQRDQHKTCRGANNNALKKLYQEGALSQEQYHRLTEVALARGCYVDYAELAWFTEAAKSGTFALADLVEMSMWKGKKV